MSETESSVRGRFRWLGRRVLRAPADRGMHERRVRLACRFSGAEPLQGALADMLCACDPDPVASRNVLLRPRVSSRLAAHVLEAFVAQADSARRLRRVHPLATRWSVLAVCSFDVPLRARLCGADDSRALAARALARIRSGDAAAESEFLEHCLGSHDTLAFMLARRALMREGRALSPLWTHALDNLQHEAAR